MTIVDAKFYIDVELFGKQDPYVKFSYANIDYKTTIKHILNE